MAEANRTPFDFAEGESELVSGFNIEFGGGAFALIFMGEYLAILAKRFITAAIFCYFKCFTLITTIVICPLLIIAPAILFI